MKRVIKYSEKRKNRISRRSLIALIFVFIICMIPAVAYAASGIINVTGVGETNIHGKIGPTWVIDDALDAKGSCDTEVNVSGTAELTITLFYAKPYGTGDIPTPYGVKYFDVLGDDVSGTTSLEVMFYFDSGDISDNIDRNSLIVFWWNGSAWQPCSDYTIVWEDSEGYIGYASIYIDNTTSPTLSQLTGTEFMIGSYLTSETLNNMVGLLPLIFVAGMVMSVVAGVAYGMNIEKVILIGIFMVLGMSLLGVISSAM